MSTKLPHKLAALPAAEPVPDEYTLGYRHADRTPRRFRDELRAGLFRAAKQFSQVTHGTWAEALEALSRAGGWPDWAKLSRHLDAYPDVPSASDADWLDKLDALRPLSLEPFDGMALGKRDAHALEALAHALSAETDFGVPGILDRVFAPLFGQPNWARALSMGALCSREPLYRVSISTSPKAAYFELSPAGQALEEELVRKYLASPGRTPDLRDGSIRAWHQYAVGRQPDFLAGLVSLGWVEWYNHRSDEALYYANAALGAADALLPAGFKGRVPYEHSENRFYLEGLALHVESLNDQDYVDNALASARRALRVDPGDALYLRPAMVLLLIETGDATAALREAHKLQMTGDPAEELVVAFAHFAAGNLLAFRSHLLHTLFVLPQIRELLTPDMLHKQDKEEMGTRGIVSNFRYFSRFASRLYALNPQLAAACREVLSEPGVRSAEDELRFFWYGFWNQEEPVTSRADWEHLLAKRLAELRDPPANHRRPRR